MSVKTGVESRWYVQPAPADFSKLVVEQLFCDSKDGTRIPMFIFRRKDLQRDGAAPLLLSGYGAANQTYQPNFNPLLVPWVERGGIHAWASLRGGRRVWRGLASRRQSPEQAEHLRRLHRRGRVSHFASTTRTQTTSRREAHPGADCSSRRR